MSVALNPDNQAAIGQLKEILQQSTAMALETTKVTTPEKSKQDAAKAFRAG